MTGGTAAFGVLISSPVQSDVTSAAYGIYTQANTQAAAFTLGTYTHFAATQNPTLGAGSAITTQEGFLVSSTMIGASNNRGFRGQIPSGANRWNLYMDGTASNHLMGDTFIGSTTSTGAYKLQVTGSIYVSTLTGVDTLLKTVNGVITRALDGTDYYSPATISNANYWTLNSGNVYRPTGNVGIGVVTPTAKLHIEMPDATVGVIFRKTGATNNPALYFTVNESTRVSQIDATGSTSGILTLATSGVERLRVDNVGNVGIGTTSLIDKITIDGGNLSVMSGNSIKLFHSANNNWSSIYSPASGVFSVNTGGVTDALYITTTGDVGFGTTNPSGKLHIVKNGSAILKLERTTGSILRVNGDNDATGFQIYSTTNNSVAYSPIKIDGSTLLLNTDTGGRVGIGIATPNSKLHIRDASNSRIWLDNSSSNMAYSYFEVNTVSTPYLAIQAGDSIAYRNIHLNGISGNVVVGSNGAYTSDKFQVNGGIYSTTLTGSTVLLKVVSGVVTRAESTDLTGLVGDYYIKNQYVSAQNANLWVNGNQRADNYTKSGRKGYYGTYNAAQVQGIWAISESYAIDTTANNDFGSQYGIVYSYTDAGAALPNGTSTRKAITSWGHQILYTDNGVVTSGISLTLGSVWQLGQSVYGNYASTLYTNTSYSFVSPNTTSYLANNLELGKTGTAGLLRFRRSLDGSSNGIGSIGFTGSGNLNITSSETTNGIITFTIVSTEVGRYTNSGKFLIGATAENSYKAYINSGSAAGDGLYVNGHIRATGNIIADGYFSGTSSDIRHKSNLREIKVIDVIDKINIYSYDHKLYNNSNLIGSIAQDVEKYFPQLVTKDEMGYLRVDNYGYAALALQLGKEIKSEVFLLKEKVKELENKIQLLENR
jgi:hypothetical protein